MLIWHNTDESIISLTLYEWNQLKDKMITVFNNTIIPLNETIVNKKLIKVVNPPKVLLKKKNVKKVIINIVEDKMVSNTYLDCSKELTFEDFIK